MPKVEWKPSSKFAKNRSKSRRHSKSTETKNGQATPSTTFNIINGHDYTDAQFEEVDLSFKNQVAPGLPEIDVLTLCELTLRGGPGRKYNGLGWRDLLAESTWWDIFRWLSMGDLASMARKFRTNDDCKFRVWFLPPGLLHIEVDDDGEWSIQDIVALPEWMFMG